MSAVGILTPTITWTMVAVIVMMTINKIHFPEERTQSLIRKTKFFGRKICLQE